MVRHLSLAGMRHPRCLVRVCGVPLCAPVQVGIDLVYKKTIGLSEALCGLTLHIKHLDGRVLKVPHPPGV